MEQAIPDCDDYFDFIEQKNIAFAKILKAETDFGPAVEFKLLSTTQIPPLFFESVELQKIENINLFIENLDKFNPFDVVAKIYHDEKDRKCLSFTKIN